MPSITTRLELIKNNRTITKVIFNQKGNALDVKLCIPCNDYYIKGYKLFDDNPITGRVTKSEDVKTERLKLFTLTNGLLLFDDWLNSYWKMKEIS